MFALPVDCAVAGECRVDDKMSAQTLAPKVNRRRLVEYDSSALRREEKV